MKDGTRGWMTVGQLREMLIEIPGECMLTPLEDNKLHISSLDRKNKVGQIDFIKEVAVMEKQAA